MGSDDTKICAFNILDDSPAPFDAFASENGAGPHKRVADAITDLIESTDQGGMAIAFEGGWGSGKSTIVRFLTDRFSSQADYIVVLFDAWAHEGDPLRRTFIESIADELCRYGWADKDTWRAKRLELANRRKTITTRTTTKPTVLGTLVAISLVLIPAGATLIAGGFRKGVTWDWSHQPNWQFLLGVAFMSSLLLVSLRYPYLHLRRALKRRSRPNARSLSDNNANGDQRSDWALISSQENEETTTETVETPNPTSLEFDDYFCRLMAESLNKDSRRLLLVLDNLDRVDSDTALSIWGTLQTFLYARNYDSHQWFKQLWLLVPYDPTRLQRLWNLAEEHARDEDEAREKSPRDARRTAESFLDKSFQVRFHVAPPVLSDWKSFLYELVVKALPGHIEDQHIIYQVFDRCRTRRGDPPTPRELKLYINQIGALHQQWQHEFPIGHIAYFVLARRAHHCLINKLREGTVPMSEAYILLNEGEDLQSSLAGLAFNVEAPKGLELLLGEPIMDALKTANSDELTAIAKRNHHGFWAVLEQVATSQWRNADATTIAAIATCLQHSELLDGHSGAEKYIVLRQLKEAAIRSKSWMPISEDVANGICDLLRLQESQEFTREILGNLSLQVRKSGSGKGKVPEPDTLINSLCAVMNTARSLEHDDAIPRTITLPYKEDDWIIACESIAHFDEDAIYWNRFRSSGKFDEISKHIESSISSGELSNSYIPALQVTQHSAIKCNWENVCTAIRTRLMNGQDIPTGEVATLLHGLFQLAKLHVDEAHVAQTQLSKSGHLLHHFHRAKNQGETAAQTAITICIIIQRPSLNKPPAFKESDAGYNMLMQTLSSSEDDIVRDMTVIARRYDMIHDLLKLIDDEEEVYPLVIEVLKLIVDSQKEDDVFNPEFVIGHWHDLREHLNDDSDGSRFQNLVGRLATTHELCDAIENSDNGFDRGAALLYLDIVRGTNGDSLQFVEWCLEGLRRQKQEDWEHDLRGNMACCALCIDLEKYSHSPRLAHSFADALEGHAKAVVKNEDLPPDWMRKEWSSILDCIEELATRKGLGDRLIGTAIDADGELSDAFFEMYGNEIDDASTLAANERVLSHFFTPLVRDKHMRGLKWLDAFASVNPAFIESVPAEDTAQDFTARLQGLIDQREDYDARAIIESIAGRFRITPTPPDIEGDADLDSEVPSDEYEAKER